LVLLIAIGRFYGNFRKSVGWMLTGIAGKKNWILKKALGRNLLWPGREPQVFSIPKTITLPHVVANAGPAALSTLQSC
jgi:hypothetical protein